MTFEGAVFSKDLKLMVNLKKSFPTLKPSHMTALSARVAKPHESHSEAEKRRQTAKIF